MGRPAMGHVPFDTAHVDRIVASESLAPEAQLFDKPLPPVTSNAIIGVFDDTLHGESLW